MPFLKKEFPSPGFADLPKHKKTTMAAIGPEQAAHCGLSTNKNNGIYNRRFQFDVVKKLSFEAINQHCKEASRRPSVEPQSHCLRLQFISKLREEDNEVAKQRFDGDTDFKNTAQVNAVKLQFWR